MTSVGSVVTSVESVVTSVGSVVTSVGSVVTSVRSVVTCAVHRAAGLVHPGSDVLQVQLPARLQHYLHREVLKRTQKTDCIIDQGL